MHYANFDIILTFPIFSVVLLRKFGILLSLTGDIHCWNLDKNRNQAVSMKRSWIDEKLPRYDSK